MSFNSLADQVLDGALRARVDACANQEARNNPAVADSEVARGIVNRSIPAADTFIWAVALATEAEYASALAAGNPNPGGDESVITDQGIVSAVQGNWPADPT